MKTIHGWCLLAVANSSLTLEAPTPTYISSNAAPSTAIKVTPLSPADWSLTFNGETISLEPSIGSWSLECKSHYWITNNNVRWSHKYSSAEIEKVREVDLEDKLKYYDSSNSTSHNNSADELEKPHSGQRKFNLLDWLKQVFKIN